MIDYRDLEKLMAARSAMDRSMAAVSAPATFYHPEVLRAAAKAETAYGKAYAEFAEKYHVATNALDPK
jgi:hypothetical protein